MFCSIRAASSAFTFSFAAFLSISAQEPIFTLDGTQDDDSLGRSVAVGSDWNLDGILDIAIGIPGRNGFEGLVELRSGRDGTLIRTIAAPANAREFGTSIDATLDFTGDGHNDLVVGAPFANLPGSFLSPGTVYLINGTTGAVIHSSTGVQDNDQLGECVLALQDVNGDGTPDFAASGTGIDGPGSVSREGSIIATQPLAIGDARMSIYDLAAGKTLEVCVDGDGCSLDEGTGLRLMGADCQSDASAWATPRPVVFRRRRLTVAFEGGELTFDVVTIVGSDNPDIIGLYPVAGPLLSVEGNFRGTAIDTNNYWEMAYWAAHHGFGQYFGVVLPTPVSDTCALEVAEGVFSDPPSYTVYRLDCDFERIGELTFESVTSEEL